MEKERDLRESAMAMFCYFYLCFQYFFIIVLIYYIILNPLSCVWQILQMYRTVKTTDKPAASSGKGRIAQFFSFIY